MPTEELERRFDAGMFEIYDRAGSEVGYWATRYLQMLRRRGGLDTARYLLAQKLTSDGYAHLRDAGRLDLTVEALVLQPEFEPLFSGDELAIAADRLARYRSMPISADLEPSFELNAATQRARESSDEDRIQHRDEIAGFGAPAITAMQRWVDAGDSVGFAVAVIERVGRETDRRRALAALRRIRTTSPDWRSVVDPAISRLEAAAKN
jgi:hypothetical protein